MQLSLNLTVSVALDDSWSKVGISVRGNDETKVHEAGDNYFGVFEDSSNVAEGDFALDGRLALVHLKSRSDVGLLVFGQPLCIFGKAGYDEEKDKGNCHG